ncbi:MAG TPA: sulfite oxidase [Bryobacteraceae bacterium]|nr:sulfite oxidase [Bryobacteraceae bacterium]
MPISRRGLLQTLLAAGSFSRAVQSSGADMIIRSARPEDFEMPLEGFATWITPVDRFFVRTHVYTPKVDPAQWRLRIEGEVATPMTLSLADLRQFPRAELVSVLECAGNGRGFYQPAVAGLQWTHGAVGNARWSGIRLADVLKKAGPNASAKEVLLNGADVPLGTMPDFVRTIPLEKAVHRDTLLAFEMNGEPLNASHGFPLRVVAPGWAGDNWVKWLTNVEVRHQEFDGFFMKTAYRRPVRTVAPGAAVDPADMTPVTSIRPKSVIASPVEGQTIATGPSTIRGAAWSGESPLKTVEVSTDRGRSWHPAKLGPERAKYAWRLWEADWNAERRGSYVLMARATDEAGETQPLVEEWNPSGYLWNVIPQVRVEAGGAEAVPAQQAPAPPALPTQVRETCIGCHGEDMIAGQHLTRPQWEREVDKMTRWGASVKPENRDVIIDFLLSHFGPQR